eukprot:6560418-Ditylum_brightwellii.AAC.1
MAPQTVRALVLRPTTNQQGGYFFFSLNSGQWINRNRWTVLSMLLDTVDCVHKMAEKDPLGVVVEDGFGTESLHKPPQEQDGEGSDGVLTIMPEENYPQEEEDNNTSLPSIPSIQDAKICHETGNFDLSDTTTATTSAAREPNPALDNVNINLHAGGDEHITGVEQEDINTGVHQTDV